jgi:hypothetical protein
VLGVPPYWAHSGNPNPLSSLSREISLARFTYRIRRSLLDYPKHRLRTCSLATGSALELASLHTQHTRHFPAIEPFEMILEVTWVASAVRLRGARVSTSSTFQKKITAKFVNASDHEMLPQETEASGKKVSSARTFASYQADVYAQYVVMVARGKIPAKYTN